MGAERAKVDLCGGESQGPCENPTCPPRCQEYDYQLGQEDKANSREWEDDVYLYFASSEVEVGVLKSYVESPISNFSCTYGSL